MCPGKFYNYLEGGYHDPKEKSPFKNLPPSKKKTFLKTTIENRKCYDDADFSPNISIFKYENILKRGLISIFLDG